MKNIKEMANEKLNDWKEDTRAILASSCHDKNQPNSTCLQMFSTSPPRGCGPGKSSGKAGSRGVNFSSLPHVQIRSGDHSLSYKKSTGTFIRRKGDQTSHPTSSLVPWLCICGTLYSHPLWAFMACKWGYLYLYHPEVSISTFSLNIWCPFSWSYTPEVLQFTAGPSVRFTSIQAPAQYTNGNIKFT